MTTFQLINSVVQSAVSSAKDDIESDILSSDDVDSRQLKKACRDTYRTHFDTSDLPRYNPSYMAMETLYANTYMECVKSYFTVLENSETEEEEEEEDEE